MVGGSHEGEEELEEELPPNCPDASLAPPIITSNSKPPHSTGRAHSSGLDRLSKNSRMIVDTFDARSPAKT